MDEKPDRFGPYREEIAALHASLYPRLAEVSGLPAEGREIQNHQLSLFEYRDEKFGEDYTYLLFDVDFAGNALPCQTEGLILAVSNRYRDQGIPRGYLESTFADDLARAWAPRFPVTLTWKESRRGFPADQDDTILTVHHFSGRRQVFKVVYPFRAWGGALTTTSWAGSSPS